MTQHIDASHHASWTETNEQHHRNAIDSIFLNRSRVRANRLTKYEVEEARSRRLRTVQMWSIIREILSYLIFLWMIYTIAYSNRNDNAFRQVNHLCQFFLNTGHRNYDYTKVKSFCLFI